MSNAQYPRLAGVSDVPRLISGDRVSHQWPPPGCEVIPVSHPEPWGLVVGPLGTLPEDTWYVTTLAEFVLELPDKAVQIMARVVQLLAEDPLTAIAAFAGAASQWPVILDTNGARTMRWIKSTFKGTLCGIDEFQFGINWGRPGNDPNMDDAALAQFAEDVAGDWAIQWPATAAGFGIRTLFPPTVIFTEVGAVMMEATEATDKDGKGGNASQQGETQWFAYPTADRLIGTGTNPILPTEVALAVTLHTDHRGPSGRGRLYLPPFSAGLMDNAGLFLTTGVTTAGAAIGGLFERVLASTGMLPLVVSKRRLILNEVVQVTVGKVPDSQRRRRSSFVEAPVLGWEKP